MASIHQHEKSPYWYVAYTLADGRRAFRSTHQRERKKALEVARVLDRASQAARADVLTEADVRKWMDELLEGSGLNPVRNSTVRAFCDDWLAGKRLTVGQATGVRLTRALRLLVEGLGPRADKPLSALTAADIAAYRNGRLKENVASGTLAHYLQAVRSMLSTARRQGLILTNPAEAVELPRKRAHERLTFTLPEIGALLTVAEPEWRTLILLGFYSGGRLTDLARLSWNSIDLTAGLITFTSSKTNSRVTVPIHPALSEHLLSIAGDSTGPLCPALSRTPPTGRRGLSRSFVDLMTEAGIDSQSVKTSKNKFSAKSFHALRHTFTSQLANSGIPAELRMKLTGHSSPETHRVYTKIELETLRGAIQALPRL